MADQNDPKAPKILRNVRPTEHFTPKTQERKWLLVDASGQRVGRLATQIATLLRGKHKPTFTTHDDAGDFVVVVNADKVVLHGNNKLEKKQYHKHTGWMGHLRTRSARDVLERDPKMVLQLAVKGMMPRGALANHQMKKLKIYAGGEHPHKAQQPQTFATSN